MCSEENASSTNRKKIPLLNRHHPPRHSQVMWNPRRLVMQFRLHAQSITNMRKVQGVILDSFAQTVDEYHSFMEYCAREEMREACDAYEKEQALEDQDKDEKMQMVAQAEYDSHEALCFNAMCARRSAMNDLEDLV